MRRLTGSILLLIVAPLDVGAQPSFTGLGDLPDPFGVHYSEAFAVSADGSVVAGRGEGAGGARAFRWTASGGMVDLGTPGAPPGTYALSEASGISADGSVVVGGNDDNYTSGYQAFRWTISGGMVGLGDLPGGGVFSFATAVSADGHVLVGRSDSASSGSEAFRWTVTGGMVGLGDLPGSYFFSNAMATSSDGSVVVGGSQSELGTEAFRWTEDGGMVGLGDIPGGGFGSFARDVSDDGSIVVGYGHSPTSSVWEAFRWTEAGGMVGLGDLPGGKMESFAYSVSGDGAVVVGVGTTEIGREAFIWDAVHGMRNLEDVLRGLGLDLTGWRLYAAYGISQNGRFVVGHAGSPNGGEAWIADLPEPSFGLLAGALAVFGLRRRAVRSGRAR